LLWSFIFVLFLYYFGITTLSFDEEIVNTSTAAEQAAESSDTTTTGGTGATSS
jgi:hypothetical protein